MLSNFRFRREVEPTWQSFMSISLHPDAIPMMTSNSAGVIISRLLPMRKAFSILLYVPMIFSTPELVPLMQAGVIALFINGRRKW